METGNKYSALSEDNSRPVVEKPEEKAEQKHQRKETDENESSGDITDLYSYGPRNVKVYEASLMDLLCALNQGVQGLNEQKNKYTETLLNSDAFKKVTSLLKMCQTIFKEKYPYDGVSKNQVDCLAFKSVFQDSFKTNNFPGSGRKVKEANVVTLVQAIASHLRPKTRRLENRGYGGMLSDFTQSFASSLDEVVTKVFGEQEDREITVPRRDEEGNFILNKNGEREMVKKMIRVEPLVMELNAIYGHASLVGKQEADARRQMRAKERQQQKEQHDEEGWKSFGGGKGQRRQRK